MLLEKIFPGFDEAMLINDKRQSVKRLEKCLYSQIEKWMSVNNLSHFNTLFLPYFSLHEFEALLYSDLHIIESFLKHYNFDTNNILKNLELSEEYDPEMINDNRDTTPKHRLETFFKRYNISFNLSIRDQIMQEYKIKNPDKLIGLFRKRCFHFNEWLTNIENLIARG
jgi:hypothetical protein